MLPAGVPLTQANLCASFTNIWQVGVMVGWRTQAVFVLPKPCLFCSFDLPHWPALTLPCSPARQTYEFTPADRSLLVMPLFHVCERKAMHRCELGLWGVVLRLRRLSPLADQPPAAPPLPARRCTASW